MKIVWLHKFQCLDFDAELNEAHARKVHLERSLYVPRAPCLILQFDTI
jgi:hypothetical protein